MKEFAIPYILENFGVKNPRIIYCRIDKFSSILNNFSYDNLKNNVKNYNDIIGGSNNNTPRLELSTDNSQPPPIDIKKFIDKYKNEHEQYKTIKIIYKNIEYTFKIFHDNELAYYYLFRTNDENQNLACVHIIVDKNNNVCEIHNILYHKDCMPTAEMNDKKGKTLIKLALMLINKIKDRYNIKKIFLSDNSKKICKNKEIELHKMLTLLTGTTWYAKYGFIPVNKILNKKFEENKIIISNTYLKDIPQLRNYLIKLLKDKHQKILEKILSSYDQALKMNSKLNEYLQFFLYNYDDNCYIFYSFYEKLYEDLKLTNMGNQQFVKEI